MSGIRYEIRDLADGAGGEALARDVASLHRQLLSHSPLVLMGPDFMEKFYYRLLPRDGLINGAVAYVDGVPAGFVVATDDADGFMRAAIRRHWLRLAWIMVSSITKRPASLRAIREAQQIQRNVEAVRYGPGVGELLSFGVLPAFRSRQFLRAHDIQISRDLMARAMTLLQQSGCSRVRAIVDKDNVETKLFYMSQGWRVGLATVKGWSVPTMEFLIDLKAPKHEHMQKET